MMFCGKCGKQIDEQARFCPYCGAVQNLEFAPMPVGNPDRNDLPIASGKKQRRRLSVAAALVAAVIAAAVIVPKLSAPLGAGGRFGSIMKNKVEYVKVLETEYNSYGDILSYKGYEYDEAGNMIKTMIYDEDHNLSDYYEYEYNAKGTCTRAVSYKADGTMLYTTEYTIDRAGNQTDGYMYDSDGEEKSHCVMTYDANGNRTKEITYKEGSRATTRSYEYDESGNVISLQEDDTRFTYQYDDQGNQIEVAAYNSWGEQMIRQEFSYDENGNQIDSVVYGPTGLLKYYIEFENMTLSDHLKEKK